VARGFTLVELLIALAVLGITISFAVPSMGEMVERNRVRGAVEALYSEFQFVRMEAVKRNTPLSLTFSGGTGDGSTDSWCFGLDENPGCDCTITDVDNGAACALMTAGENVLKTVSSESYKDISLNQTFAADSATFNPVRGTVNAGTMTFESPHDLNVQLQVTVLGRIDSCSDNVLGYSGC